MTTLETLANGTAVHVNSTHRFGADGILLASFSGVRRAEAVCELGSGCGIIPLYLYDKGHRGIYTAVEIDKCAHSLLMQSVAANHCENIEAICGDLRKLGCERLYDAVICNPPYFKGGYLNKDEAKSIQRHETMCTVEDVCLAASRLLKDGARLCVCQRCERLADVMCAMRANNIEPKLLRLVYAKPDSAKPWLFLLKGLKRRKSGLIIAPPLIMQDASGGLSQELREIYGIK